VADPEVDPSVRAASIAVLLVLAVAAAGLVTFPSAAAAGAGPAGAAASPAATAVPRPTGNLSGPALVGTSSNTTFYLNATGGPAYVNGTFVGAIDWNATLVGHNTSGSSVSPGSGNLSAGSTQPVAIVVTTGKVTGPLTLVVELKSELGATNSTTNLSRSFQVVVPYVVRATLIGGANANVLPFNVTVALDGTVVGKVLVPGLTPKGTYKLVFSYPTLGLASGYHTFTLSIENVHGLVTFPNGQTVQATTFYVAPAPASNTLWYVVGVVAFFGVLFIYATRVAARRRGSGRR
jgi:hypothetical protein